MTSLIQNQFFVCGFDEMMDYHSQRISHLITIANPGALAPHPPWFRGRQLELRFGDVTSKADARRWQTDTPSIGDIQRAVIFAREAWSRNDSKMLVSCHYGASRSPALAYVLLADLLGAGREAEAFRLAAAIRPVAIPNSLVVRLGDAFLHRGGALIAPLKRFCTEMNAETFRS